MGAGRTFLLLLTWLAMATRLAVGLFDDPDPVQPCSMHSCFNISRCEKSAKIYIYPLPDGEPSPSCDILHFYAAKHFHSCFLYTLLNSQFDLTDDPDEACLLIPSLDATCATNTCTRNDFYYRGAELHALPYWNGGQNHVVWNYQNDWPNPGFDVGQAILVRASSINSTYRPGFDVALPLARKGQLNPLAPVVSVGSQLLAHEQRSQAAQSSSETGGAAPQLEAVAPPPPDVLDLVRLLARGRYLLLFFRGCVLRFGGPVCEHRIRIFGEKLPPPTDIPDVVLIAACCDNHDHTHYPTLPHCQGCNNNVRHAANGSLVSCTAAWPDIPFDEGIQRAKFAFTPRGCGPLSYRMLEAMGQGAVPVLTGWGAFVPFAGEGDLGRLWERCVVHIPEDELKGMVGRLRAMSEEEYLGRLAACVQIAAMDSHTLQALTQQALCVILSRVAAAGGTNVYNERCKTWHLRRQ